MELKTSDEYAHLAIEWQHRVIAILKKKLGDFNIENDLAEEIVGEFMFDLAMLHDQEEITVNGNPYSPRIVFDDHCANLITSEESSLHEYAFESTADAYGE